MTFVKTIGDKFIEFVYQMGKFVKLIFQTIRAFGDFRTWSGLVTEQMMRIGIQSIPLIIYISLFMGMVVALQSVRQFTQTVPLYITGTVVEKSILQELSRVLTALVLAGRVGAANAAEIGTMRVTEQIDALEAMAFNPIAYLVVPRLIAGMVMLPVLTVISGFVGLMSGFLTSVFLANITTFEFFKGVKLYVELHDFTLPLAKSIFFGASIFD